MTQLGPATVEVAPIRTPTASGHPDRPPGERYYRHPGDVVRLIVSASASVLLLLFIVVASDTSDAVRADFAGIATSTPLAVRQLLVGVTQALAILVPATLVVTLVTQHRWRRIGTAIVAAGAGAATFVILDRLLGEPDQIRGALDDDSWFVSARFPSPAYLAGAVALATVGKPWLARGWRRSTDVAIIALGVAMAVAGSAGLPELLLAAAAGGVAGSAILVAFGAPNRRPTPSSVASALRDAGIDIGQLDLERADGGRAQLYRARTSTGSVFVKVYSRDSRDADLLFRSYRAVVLRDPGDRSLLSTMAGDVEHEALVLLVAERAGVASPRLLALVPMVDGSTALAMNDVATRRLDQIATEHIDDGLLDAVWQEVATLHRAGLAHGALRAANVLVTDGGRPAVIDFGSGALAADARSRAIDRAELLVSLAALVGTDRAVESASRVVDTDDLAAAAPYLQPLALTAATRRAGSKGDLRTLRAAVAQVTAREPVSLERLVRVRPRTLVTIATLTGAFYVLLPQLANVDDSVEALGSANWVWLAGAIVMSGCTYVTSAVGTLGGVSERLPFVATVQVSLASSFVNRVTPANVGGMALNVRYLQKAGVPPAEAVTGIGLNVVAGGVVHLVLLVVFFAWAGQTGSTGFSIPGGSRSLVVIAVVLALAGLVLATRRGRHVVRARVMPSLRQASASLVSLARSPVRMLALFGGSAGVTLAYVTALACSVAAFDGGVSYAQVGAVYLGASLIAAAAPTPGGLGAIEAALVAGFTGIDVEPAIAVAAVLSYRLVTYWLPILPGWLCFRFLDRRHYI